jgi:hypothetical protein
MTLKKENLRRLASLSALGAGALGTAGTADANDIVFSGVVNVDVPYSVSVYTIPGPNGAGAIMKPGFSQGGISSFFYLESFVYMIPKPGKHGTQCRFLATSSQKVFGEGEPLAAMWATAAGRSTKSAIVALHYESDGGDQYDTTFSATDRYLLFRFQGGDLTHAIYGWARMRITFHPFESPQVNLIDWAYDTSGAQLPAGYHGPGQHDLDDPAAIAPSAFDATGLPALALGSLGVRNWRAAREARIGNTGSSTPLP